jgi:predicted aspartyl protease
MKALPPALAAGILLAAFAHAADTVLREKIPDVFTPILIEVKVNGEPHLMLLDTGATGVAFDTSLSKHLTTEVGVAKFSDASLGTIKAYKAPPMKAQSLVVRAPFVAAIDLKKFSRLFGVEIGGVLNAQSLGLGKIYLNYGEQQLEVNSGPWRLEGPGVVEVDLEKDVPTPAFKTDLAGHPVTLSITTASDQCIELPHALFDTLVKEGVIQRSKTDGFSNDATGDTSYKKGWFVKGTLMGKKLSGVSVAADEEGRIGRAWLCAFNMEIDWPLLQMRYEPLPAPSPPFHAPAMIGGDFEFRDGRMFVESVSEGAAAQAAELRAGDEIEEFGGLKAERLNMAAIAEVVAANAGKSVAIRYRRKIDGASAAGALKLPAPLSLWNFAGRDTARPAAADAPEITILKQKISRLPSLHTTEALIGGKKRLMLIDTGAEGTVFDSSLADLVGTDSTDVKVRDSRGEKIPLKSHEGSSIEAQSLVIKRPRVIVANLHPISEFFGIKFEGCLGYRDFAATGKVFIDYDNALLEIHTGDWRLRSPDCHEVALLEERAAPSFQTELIGHPVEFAIDTGYNGTLSLPAAVFEELVTEGAIEISKAGGRTVSLSGSSERRSGWFLKGELMGKKLRGVSVAPGADHGLIGLTWLCGFNTEIDRAALKFRYQKRANATSPASISMMTGLMIKYGDHGPVVAGLRPGGKGPAEVAGLKVDDRIEKFGPLAAAQMNYDTVGEAVIAAAGKAIDVTYIRGADGKPGIAKIKLPEIKSDWDVIAAKSADYDTTPE